MYKSVTSGIKKYNLDTSLHRLHKEDGVKTNFGMDNSTELLDGGFGLYSTANVKKSIGPIKTGYYRVAIVRSGSAAFSIGLETFHPVRNGIIFGFPGQVFSLQDMTEDFFTYYMLFSENFIADSLLKDHYNQFPFLTYAGVPCFPLTEEEGDEIEAIIGQMNEEVKNRKANASQAIRLYIQLIFLKASRSYTHKILSRQGSGDSGALLFSRFVKLVSEHFLTAKKVSDYASMLHVSSDHLNRTIKMHSDKTAHELIDEMVLRETKAYLLHSKLSVAEIGYQLGFSDPSHFNKFFKKLSGCTPLQYRNRPVK